MKKIIATVLIVVFICSLVAGCKNREEAEKNIPISSSQASTKDVVLDKEKPPVIREAISKGAGGGADIFSGTHFTLEEGETIQPLPVYVNPYPTGQVGELFDLAEEERAKVREKVETYVYAFYGEQAEEKVKEEYFSVELPEKRGTPYRNIYYQDGSYVVRYADDVLQINATIATMMVFMNPADTGLADSMKNGDSAGLLETPFVKAAVQTLGIENILFRNVNEKRLDGSITELRYKGTEKGDNLSSDVYSDAFRFFVLSSYPEETGTISMAIHDYSPQREIPLQAVSLEEARAYVQENYPDKFTGDISCTVCYDQKVEPGFCIPCYRFTGNGGYEISIAMADYGPIIDTFVPGEEFVWPREESQPVSSELEPASSEPEPVSSELSEPETVTSLPPEEN